jgi:hypothetical protein
MNNTPSRHSLETVQTIMQHLAHAQIATWLFGGWAEQLHALCPPGPHTNQTISIASIQALSLYRQKHQHITDAYRTYHQK